jgi:hypothetical protein
MAHAPAPTPFYSLLGKAQWSSDYANRLPDSAFLVLEPGGRKDEAGRTAPRSLRHLPVYDAEGHLDLPHLVDAITQLPKAGPWLAGPERDRLRDKAQGLLERAQATTHKAAAKVPLWALGYLRSLDTHEALGIGRPLPKGTWMLAARFVDDELWNKVKARQITGWSIGGLATRTPIAT